MQNYTQKYFPSRQHCYYLTFGHKLCRDEACFLSVDAHGQTFTIKKMQHTLSLCRGICGLFGTSFKKLCCKLDQHCNHDPSSRQPHNKAYWISSAVTTTAITTGGVPTTKCVKKIYNSPAGEQQVQMPSNPPDFLADHWTKAFDFERF